MADLSLRGAAPSRCRAHLKEGEDPFAQASQALRSVRWGIPTHPRCAAANRCFCKARKRSSIGAYAEHPGFEKDFASLVAAGIFEYEDGILRVLPADKDEVAAHAARGFTDRAQYFAGVGGDEAVEALAVALSATGIEQPTRVAEDVVGKGSETQIIPPGPILELLSKLAEEGELVAVSRAWRVFRMVHPESADLLRDSVPAKILSPYLTRNRGIDPGRMVGCISTSAEWLEAAKAALHDPAHFKKTVDEMADAIAATR